MGKRPVLWHIPVSHFSEKVRWALAYKAVDHDRRAPIPGAHIPVALWLTRGAAYTFPVLRLEGRNVADSTAIIAALERSHPQPALHPADPGQRRRALELEEYFDEQLGPHIRLLAWHELRLDAERMQQLSAGMVPGRLGKNRFIRAGAGRFGSAYVQVRFRVAGDEAADAARARVVGALDRLEAELDVAGGDYLAGDGFSVADLTAAALFYPLVDPAEGPRVLPDPPPAFERFVAPLRERPGYRWVAEMFRRHRLPAARDYQPSVPGSPL